MRLHVPILACALLITGVAARADSVFIASGAFDDGSRLSGTLTIDPTTGLITGSDLILTGASSYTFVNILNQSYTQSPGDYNVEDRDASSTDDFNFALPDPSQMPLINYAGGTICSIKNPCPDGRGSNLFDLTTNGGGPSLVSGTLTAVTPEPSSLVLLGSGVLGVAGVLKRRCHE